MTRSLSLSSLLDLGIVVALCFYALCRLLVSMTSRRATTWKVPEHVYAAFKKQADAGSAKCLGVERSKVQLSAFLGSVGAG